MCNLTNIDLSETHISFIGKRAFDTGNRLIKLPANKIKFNNVKQENGNKIIEYYTSKVSITSDNPAVLIPNGVKQVFSNGDKYFNN